MVLLSMARIHLKIRRAVQPHVQAFVIISSLELKRNRIVDPFLVGFFHHTSMQEDIIGVKVVVEASTIVLDLHRRGVVCEELVWAVIVAGMHVYIFRDRIRCHAFARIRIKLY